MNKPDSFLDEEGSCVVPKEYSWIYGGWEADDGFQLLITKKGLRKVFDKNSEDIRLVEPLEFTFNILNNVPQLCYQDPEFDYSMEIILDGFRDEFKRVQISPMSKKEIAENLKQLECHPVQGSWQFKNTKFTIIKDRRVDYETKEGDEKVTLLKNGNLRIGNSEFEYDATRDVLITGYSNTDDYVTITYKRIK